MFLRMKPGHGEVLIAQGDVDVPDEERELIEAFRRQLDEGMWAAVPVNAAGGRREAALVKEFGDLPRDAERVIFVPRAAGGCERAGARAAAGARDGAAGGRAAGGSR